MKKLLFLVTFSVVTLLHSCVSPEKLSFDGIDAIQLKGITSSQVGVDLGIKATNASGSNFTLTDMQVTISKEGQVLTNVVLREKVRMSRKSSGVITLPLGIRFDGPLGALGVYSSLSKGLQNTTISGYVTVRTGWCKKKFKIPEIQLDQMAQEYGFDPTDLLKNLQRL